MEYKQTVWDIETDEVFELTIALDHLVGTSGRVTSMVKVNKGEKTLE